MIEQLSYKDYEKLVDDKVSLIENEKTEIVQFMYNDGWFIKDTINHIDSVRRFNKTLKEE